MKKQFKLTQEEMKNIKGGNNGQNAFPQLPAHAQEVIDNLPALPTAQNGNGKRPF